MGSKHLSLGLACALAATLGAQTGAVPPPAQPPELAPGEQPTIAVDVNRVNLLFTVTDRRGRFVTNLTRDDFEVWEGKNRQSILEFTSESDLPLRLAILIDTSNSIRDRFRFQQEAAVEFVQSVVTRTADKAVIVSFDTEASVEAALTNDPRELERSIRRLRAGGGTALYDAIYHACRDQLSQDQPLHLYRRAMIILSDGDDNQSRYSRDQALEMAHKADVVIYSISTNISRRETDGDKVLKYYAEETGGLTFFPFKVEDLRQSFENIANEMRHQYNLLYRPEPLRTDGQYQPVDLRIRGRRSDFVVRARRGYYAPRL